MLVGTGTAGAYHAGVLRALHEAGVKIDLMAGTGMGVAGAVFGAVDGGARLWDPKGLWRGAAPRGWYRWRPVLRASGWLMLGVAGALLVPVALVLLGALVYPLGLVLDLAGLEAGTLLTAGYGRLLAAAFAPGALPTLLPRFITLILIGLLLTVGVSAMLAAVRSRVKRRLRGPVWWRLIGAPFSAREALTAAGAALWQFIRGAASIAQPARVDLSRRYTELLADNLGQPGFREIVLAVHDLDARRDLVFALLAQPWRREFFQGATRAGRQADTFDLAGVGRDHLLDVVGGALSLPVATEPHLMTFAPESYWRGETHRLCGRPEGLGRLLEEVAAAGAEQVVLVPATEAPGGPHGLSTARTDPRSRIGEYLMSAESAALRDAADLGAVRFEAVFTIRPAHNPLGPFDLGGSYDDRSDRVVGLGELVERGYEDAYRQFIDPVVGASGERIAEPDRRPVRAEPPVSPGA